jgi:Tfp pilus assembly pilus retraction ATPase PilT
MIDLLQNNQINYNEKASFGNSFSVESFTKCKIYSGCNSSQKQALEKACLNRLTLVQGPPGTGKTKLLAAIVAFMKMHSTKHILVCANQNETADLLY